MPVVTMQELLESGVHFGHHTQRWNPKMESYIFTERNGVHIIDLQQTVTALDEAYATVRDVAGEGGTILFVGTKRQAQNTIEKEAIRCGMPYVVNRWLGGTLTNFQTIRQRIDYLLDLEARHDRGDFSVLPKKEALELEREMEKLNERFGGIKNLNDLPDIVYVVDPHREDIAVHECNILEIPVVAMVDTNCDPDLIDYVIPANDDAIRATRLITAKIAGAVLEGKGLRQARLAEEEAEELAMEEVDTSQRVFTPEDMAPGEAEEFAASIGEPRIFTPDEDTSEVSEEVESAEEEEEEAEEAEEEEPLPEAEA